MLVHLVHQHAAQGGEEDNRENPADQEIEQRIVLPRNLGTEPHTCGFQSGAQSVIRKNGRLVDRLLSVLGGGEKDYLVFGLVQGYLADLPFIHPCKEVTVADLLDLPGQNQRKDKCVQKKNNEHSHYGIRYDWFSVRVWILVLNHGCPP